MYERSYGYRYAEMKDKPLTEIAAQMRKDIKAAVADGLLPGAPVKYSVRTEHGSSIDVTVTGWPEAWKDCDGYIPDDPDEPRAAGRGRDLCRNHFCAAMLALCGETRPGAGPHAVLTADARSAELTLKRIHSAYNHDGSDIQSDYFDVRYYGGVTFQDASSAAFWAGEAEKKAARRAAVDKVAADAETRRVVVYGGKGRRTVHDAVDVDGRTRLVCGATLWRSSVLGDGAGQALSCSRCAKRAAKQAPSAAGPREMFRYEIARRDTLRRSYVRMSLPPGDERTRAAIAALYPAAWQYRLAAPVNADRRTSGGKWEKV